MSKSCKTDQDCTDAKICSGTTFRCIRTDTKAGKLETSRRSGNVVNPKPKADKPKAKAKVDLSKPCPPEKILNPISGKCVNRTGTIGKQILNGTIKAKTRAQITSFKLCKGVKCEDNKVCNPITGKCILKKTQNGQYVLREMATRPEFKKPRLAANCIERSQIKLNPHQLKTVDVFNKTDSMLVVHEPGMGKTLTAVAAAECYLDQNPTSNVVVITMVSLLENFTKEFEKYGGVDASRYVFISYESFLSEHKKIKDKACKMFKGSLVIIDEVHELRNYESNSYNSIMDCIKYANKVFLLTATPYVNTVCDFISIINLLNKQYLVGPKSTVSKDKDLGPIFSAPNKIKGCNTKRRWWDTSENSRIEDLIEQIEPFLIGKVSYATKDASPLYPREKTETILIPMTAEYEKQFSRFFSEFARDPFYGNKRRMVNALGEDYYSNKLNFPKVIQMVSNRENKNVIFTSWLEHGVKHISKILNDNGLSYGIIEGSVGASDRANIVKDFNSGKINNLIITTAGMAGIDLVGVTNIIVIDPVWNDANLQQIIGRGVRFRSHMHLPENKRVVNVYLLQLVERAIFEKTLDISKSKSGDLILYKFIAKKERENRDVLKMLRKISVV